MIKNAFKPIERGGKYTEHIIGCHDMELRN
jgi:hypothetical protein